MPSSGKLSQIASRLRRTYGPRQPPRRWDNPLDALIHTLLSQSTTAANCERAYANLRRRFRTWEAVWGAPLKDADCGHPRGWAGEHQGGAHQGVAGGDLAGAGPLRPQLSPGRVGRRGPRLPGSVQGGRPQDDRLRPAVRVGPRGVSSGHPRPPRLSATGSSQRTAERRRRRRHSWRRLSGPATVRRSTCIWWSTAATCARPTIPRCDRCALAELCDFARRLPGPPRTARRARPPAG